ncbi:ferrous iron transport protein A [Roseiconus nitratireducens]|uniref:Ferrous iron transport protein A n=1 Tax=Roseiconus nitratireducens TaxID=2605748 RepID=A0A5M6CZ21_9BACT|nr:FeoA family protein [Roseiconus nitratireducens]KAA5538549.1 ferrous iron transport protein A [Roseiconus nitratireducens]
MATLSMPAVSTAPVATSSLTLAEIGPGWVRCQEVTAVGIDSIRLRRLGICPGRLVELVGRGDPMILNVSGTRIGLSRQLASFVQVEPVAGSAPASPR